MEEYVAITVSSGSVSQIWPVDPQTQSAQGAADLASVLNKLAEYDYKLVPGIVVPWNDITVTIFMARTK
jgi:hypothetical protein